MAPKMVFSQLTPLVLNQGAPVAPTLKVKFDAPPTSVSLHLDALGSNLALAPAGPNLFSAVVPAAALTTGLGAADVNRKFIGHLQVTTGAQVDQYNMFGDVLTIKNTLGHQTTKSYDTNRNLATETDPDNNATTYFHDADDELTVVLVVPEANAVACTCSTIAPPAARACAVAVARRGPARGAAAWTLRCWATIPRGSSGRADTISAGVGTVRTSVPAGGDAGALAGSIVAAGPSSAGGAGTTGAGAALLPPPPGDGAGEGGTVGGGTVGG